jgi:uncharacterized protein DUF2637
MSTKTTPWIVRVAGWVNGLPVLAKVKTVTTLIAVVGAVVSFITQRALLEFWNVELFSQWAIPFTVDLLAIVCFVAAHQRLTWVGYLVVFTVMTIALGVSGAANWYFPGHTWSPGGDLVGVKAAHLWTVFAYLLAECVTLVVALKPSATPEKNPNRVAGGRRAAAKRLAKAAPTSKASRTTTRMPRAPKPATVTTTAANWYPLGTPAPVSPAPAGAANAAS